MKLLGRGKLHNWVLKTAMGLLTIMAVGGVYANPVLDNVAAGNVSVQQTPNSTVVNQASQKAVINWQSFNIGASESTHFQQPAGGVALNRISPNQGASQIYGRLTATGQIILMNSAGIFFGPNAYVNVGGLVATTGQISDSQFLSGNHYQFTNAGHGSIINEGQIIAAQHGLIALAGGQVTNKGVIQANLGKVVLASGDAFTMNFDGSNLINFTVDQKTTAANRGVRNTGSLIADGGTILVTAKAAQGVLDNVINMQGIVQARSVAEQNGEIIFSGDTDAGVVTLAANIDASGLVSDQIGGNVQVTGYNILLDSPTVIDVSGNRGAGVVRVGGNYHGEGPLPNANAVVMKKGAMIAANAIVNGNGGEVILWADDVTKAFGSISAQGGSLGGDGGFIETSGKNYLDVAGIKINAKAPYGKTGVWLLDPSDLTISNAATADVNQAGNTFTADNNANTSNLNVTDLETALAGADVLVETTAGGAGTGTGSITVADSILWSSSSILTLDALTGVFINANINALNGGLVVNGTDISLSADVTTSLSQTYNAPVFLLNNINLQSVNGDITFAGLISGTQSLDVGADGSISVNGTIGDAPLTSLVMSANTINLNSLFVDTTSSQSFAGTVVLSQDTIFRGSGGGTVQIAVNGAMTGNRSPTFSASGGTNLLLNLSNFAGSAINNITVTGDPTGTNTLALNTVSSQTWNITGSNAGSVTGLTGMSGTLTFTDMQALQGASTADDHFILNGGSANSVEGVGGTNTLTGANVANTWNITSNDAGTVTGLVLGFAEIQNLIGGSNTDNFIFNNDVSITGSIDGGSLASTNTLDFSAYTLPVDVVLSSTNAGTGGVSGTGTNIAEFSNINSLVNNGENNQLTLPNKSNSLNFTAFKTGTLNDPIAFSGFQTFVSLSGNDTLSFNGPFTTSSSGNVMNVTFDGGTMQFIGFTSGFIPPTINVAAVINEPTENNPNPSPATYTLLEQTVGENLDDLADQMGEEFAKALGEVSVNPYCYAGG